MSGVPDYTLEDTIDFKFTTRQFSTGAPFAFASGVIEIYEDNSVTQITGAETLTLEFDGVTGLHNLRVAALAANGFENGKSYHCVVSVGTVDSVSVVGEVVQQFSIGRSAAAVDLANGTDGLGAIKTTVSSRMAEASIATTGGAVDNVTLVATTTTNSDMVGTNGALTDKSGFSLSTAGILAIWHQLTSAIVTASTIGKLIKDFLDASISSRHASGASVSSVSGSVGSLTGHTNQTGDTYALANGGAGFVATKAVVDALDTLTKAAGSGDLAAVKIAADAIKVVTDKFVFTIANQVNANTKSINDAPVTGDGNATPWDGA